MFTSSCHVQVLCFSFTVCHICVCGGVGAFLSGSVRHSHRTMRWKRCLNFFWAFVLFLEALKASSVSEFTGERKESCLSDQGVNRWSVLFNLHLRPLYSLHSHVTCQLTAVSQISCLPWGVLQSVSPLTHQPQNEQQISCEGYGILSQKRPINRP